MVLFIARSYFTLGIKILYGGCVFNERNKQKKVAIINYSCELKV